MQVWTKLILRSPNLSVLLVTGAAVAAREKNVPDTGVSIAFNTAAMR
jgi:hypothetical protein